MLLRHIDARTGWGQVFWASQVMVTVALRPWAALSSRRVPGLADAGSLRTFTVYESPALRTFRFTFTLEDAGDREATQATAAFEWVADTR